MIENLRFDTFFPYPKFRTQQKGIIQKIEIVVRSTPANTGIFCASYSILNSLMMNGLADRIRKTGKKLFVEDSRLSASENATMLEDFKSLSKRQGAV
ncbi:MAG: hypothetical protein BAJALOKI2v1_70013 [Promethearchaeota archaeon]|nr:MAG: hypothetical protein BAJALOKI2v1_70013 [Candidatus Lokiarchaeota archaeon]